MSHVREQRLKGAYHSRMKQRHGVKTVGRDRRAGRKSRKLGRQ